jgi:two-component sensor histidine kinase
MKPGMDECFRGAPDVKAREATPAAVARMAADIAVLREANASLAGAMIKLQHRLARQDGELRRREMAIHRLDRRLRGTVVTIRDLLRMQTDKAPAPAAQHMFRVALERVSAIETVLMLVQPDGGTDLIPFHCVLELLCRSLTCSLGIDGHRRCLVLEADPLRISADQAIPLAVAASELIGNAFRHAFAIGQPGTVWVQLRALPDGSAQLGVADDGRGLPRAPVFAGRAAGVGLPLVAAMAVQAMAELDLDRSSGTRMTLTFPPADAQEA